MELNYTANIKRILKDKGLQVKDLAEMLKITSISVSRLINQETPQLQSVLKLAEVLNVEPSEILFGIKEEHTNKHTCPHCGKEIKINLE